MYVIISINTSLINIIILFLYGPLVSVQVSLPSFSFLTPPYVSPEADTDIVKDENLLF